MALHLQWADSYDGFSDIIEEILTACLDKIAENPELMGSLQEDQITAHVCNMLWPVGIDAQHERKIGGHSDIAIRGPNGYLFLAEAKKHTSTYKWLLKGFQQIDTRYQTGSKNQTRGAMLIYSTRPRADRTTSRWREYLRAQRADLVIDDLDPVDLTSFRSAHPSKRTGRSMGIRHFVSSLHFDPRDTDAHVEQIVAGHKES